MSHRSSCSQWLEYQINLLINNYLLLNPSKSMSFNCRTYISIKGEKIAHNILKVFERGINASCITDDCEPKKTSLDSLMFIEEDAFSINECKGQENFDKSEQNHAALNDFSPLSGSTEIIHSSDNYENKMLSKLGLNIGDSKIDNFSPPQNQSRQDDPINQLQINDTVKKEIQNVVKDNTERKQDQFSLQNGNDIYSQELIKLQHISQKEKSQQLLAAQSEEFDEQQTQKEIRLNKRVKIQNNVYLHDFQIQEQKTKTARYSKKKTNIESNLKFKQQSFSPQGRRPQFPQMENFLALWIQQKIKKECCKVTQYQIRQKALSIIKNCFPRYQCFFRASKGWMQKFFKRHPDVFKQISSKRVKYNTETQNIHRSQINIISTRSKK